MVNTVPKKSKPFASMEAAVRFWFAHAGAGTPTRERTVDFNLAELIDAERQRALFVKKNKCVGHPAEGADGDLRANDVVPDSVAETLLEARRLDVPVMADYFRRAASKPPVVDMLEVNIAGRCYSLPRLTLVEAATPEELAAMSKLYPTRAMFNHLDEDGRRTTLKDRTAAVLKQIGEKTTYLVVEASGVATAVVARAVYSPAGLLGKRVLLLLNAMMGLGRGFAKVWCHACMRHPLPCTFRTGPWPLHVHLHTTCSCTMFASLEFATLVHIPSMPPLQVCMGSGVPCGEDLRNFVKDGKKLAAWGLPEGMHPTEYSLNGSVSGSLRYESGASNKRTRVAAWQCGALLSGGVVGVVGRGGGRGKGG
jgi:hypothetical protein